jgi:hypothetical protein
MILVQTLRQMQKVRPAILSEYGEKIHLLQREHPLSGDIGALIGNAASRAVAGEV